MTNETRQECNMPMVSDDLAEYISVNAERWQKRDALFAELLEALEHATKVLCDHACGTPVIFPADKNCVLCENIARYKQLIARAGGGKL